MCKENAWSQLTQEEQKILAQKLDAPGELTTQQVFNDLVSDICRDDKSKVSSVVAGFKNLIDNAGGQADSPVWRQIKFIDGGWLGENESMNIVISVAERSEFLAVLAQHGYEVDRFYERLNLTGGHKHSARFITETSHQPGMHFVQQHGYAEQRFDAHWDRRSVAFKKPTLKYLFTVVAKFIERCAAGLSHSKAGSALETRKQLKNWHAAGREERH